MFETGKNNADWSIDHGANVRTDYIEGYAHTFPISNEVVTDPNHWMSPKTCAIPGVRNCGFNTVKVMLEHFFGEIEDKDPNY